MTAPAQFDRELETWLASEARGDVPGELRESLIDRTRRTRQRPAWLASVRIAATDVWPGPAAAGAARFIDQPALVRYAIVAVLLGLITVGAVLLAGSLLEDRPRGRILVISRPITYQPGPSGDYWGPDHQNCAFLNEIDAASGASRELAACADMLTVAPDGRFAARTGEGGSPLIVMDLSAGSEIPVAQDPGIAYWPNGWSYDSRRLWWAACQGVPPRETCVDFIGSRDEGFEGVIASPWASGFFEPPPERPISVQGAAQGGSIWVANAIGTGWRKVAEFDDLPPTEAVLSPDGRTIAVIADVFPPRRDVQPQLWLVDADFGDSRMVDLQPIFERYGSADAFEVDHRVSWSPDGARLAWSPDGSRILVRLWALAQAPGQSRGAAWEEPPETVVVARTLLMIRPDEASVRDLGDVVGLPSRDLFGRWDPYGPWPVLSPDGRWLVQLLDGTRLEAVNLDDGTRRPLGMVPQPTAGLRFEPEVYAWLPNEE